MWTTTDKPEICLECIGRLVKKLNQTSRVWFFCHGLFHSKGFTVLKRSKCPIFKKNIRQKKDLAVVTWREEISPTFHLCGCFLTLKILKDLCGVQPGPEAGQASVPDLLPALVCDHVAILLHDHQLGHRCDLVALLQFTERKRRHGHKFIKKRHLEKLLLCFF